MTYDIPILIIAFNRPEVSRVTFEEIKRLQPSSLYVAIDGARESVEGEVEKVHEVSEIYHKVDWPCEVHYHHNDRNMGAELTVSNAISWVLNENEYCIILEDDILATHVFFDFARQMLLRYKDVENVYQVSAAQFTPFQSMETDYVFSIYGHTGLGWATWKRAWKSFSMNLDDFDSTLSNRGIRDSFSSGKAYNSFRRGVRKMQRKGSQNSSWDKCWCYVRHRDGALSIVPRCNLTQNIGVWGLHARGIEGYHKLRISEDFVAKTHPTKVKICFEYDRYHYDKYLRHSIFNKIVNKIKFCIKKCLE